jgi:hypothetical protein
MTYQFFCRFFRPKVAVWISTVWFALLLIAIFALSAYREEAFIYINF